jgi:hypothetical protein
MATPSPLTTGLFSGLVLIVALSIVYALRRAAAGVTATLGILLAYLAIPGALAKAGLLDRYVPLPAPALLLLLALTALTVVVVFSPLGRRLAGSIPLGAIVALQAFRIAVELLLHRLYLEGVVPEQMTYLGRNFDVISGITGLALGVWLLGGRTVPRGTVLAWNILGLLLLANIVLVAVLSTPVPFRRFVQGPPNLLPSVFPYVWLPSFLVQVALGSHLLVFRQLKHRTDDELH